MVSDEVFAKLQRPAGTRPARDKHRYFLEDKVVCPTCGVLMEMVMSQKRKIIRCGHRGKESSPGKGLFHPAQGNWSNVILEQTVFMQATALLDRYAYDQIFARELHKEFSKRADELRKLLRVHQRDATRERRAYDKAMLKDLTSAGHQFHEMALDALFAMKKRADASADEADKTEAELALVEERIAELPSWVTGVAEQLHALSITHPWKPASDKERELFLKLREFVGSISLENTGKVYTVVTEFMLFKGAQNISRTVKTDHIGVKVFRERKSREWQNIRKEFEEFGPRLTDAEAATMPPLRDQYGSAEDVRFLIDVAIFAEVTQVKPSEVLSCLASNRNTELRKLRTFGDLQTVVSHLRKTRGPAFSLTPTTPHTLRSEWARLVDSRDPIILLDVCDPATGKTELSDAQWNAIAGIFTNGGRLSKIGNNPRLTLNAYYTIIREKLPIWMAERAGSLPNTVHYLIRYRAMVTEVTRRLLLLQGYVSSTKFVRARRKIGNFTTVRNSDTVIAEMKASLERIEPAKISAECHIISCRDLTYNLTTDELVDRNGFLVPLSIVGKLGVRYVLSSNGATFSPKAYLLAIGSRSKAPNHGPMMVNLLRRRLDRSFPEFARAITTMRPHGYRLSARVEVIKGELGGQPAR
jgi:hypothetical protein